MISQEHWENIFHLLILWDCITSLTSAQMSSELDDIDDFFLAHSADDNEDLAFGSDGEDSDYNPELDEKVFSDMDTDSNPDPPPLH